jgi:hypothetical protein
VWNRRMFQHIRGQADAASRMLAEERGPCPDAADYGIMERFSNKLAIAPTASISIIAGNASPGIEPIAANVFLQKTLSGSFTVRNRHLQQLLAAKGMDREEVWSSITLNKGSVRDLDFLTEQEKAVFKTAFEQGRAESIAVVSAIGDQFLGWRQCGQDQRRAPVVAHLSFGEQQQDRTALPVADGVQLGVQAALGASDAARNSPF